MKHFIKLKLFANLAQFNPNIEQIEIKPGITVSELILNIGIELKQVKLIFINGRAKKINSKLYNGDRIGIFPPIGGG